MTVLDVAIGTGLVAREALRIVDRSADVVGVDVSFGMLSRAAAALPVALVHGRGEQLPFRAASFDFLSLGYALRHLDHLSSTFAEFLRVLRPGGVVCILEITRPVRPLANRALGFYIGRVMPVVARAVGRRAATRDLWRYYWHTIEGAPTPDAVLQALSGAGFRDPHRHLVQGIFSEYTAYRPATNRGATPASP
jgi:demethylmenaquinone methyltransferase/2-methoxy-6-polyprenyl-1,4-benzoquinol methylase